MEYGIIYRNRVEPGSRLSGLENVIMSEYGQPMLFGSVKLANDYISTRSLRQLLYSVKIAADSKCYSVADLILECYSGRRSAVVKDGNYSVGSAVVKDDSKPTASEIRAILSKFNQDNHDLVASQRRSHNKRTTGLAFKFSK